MQEKPIRHTDFLNFPGGGGADVIGRRKPLGHPQAKISTYISKVAMESRKKKEVSWNREIRRYQEDY